MIMHQSLRHYTIQEAADRSGISASTLRTWEIRYGWPQCVRKANGYRLFSEATVALLRDFDAAGRPISQLQDGIWNRRDENAQPVAARTVIHITTSDDLEPRWIRALERRTFGTVAEYLASLGRMRPAVRVQYVRSVREADRMTGGEFAHLIDRYLCDHLSRKAAP